jgi:hypothetical protein
MFRDLMGEERIGDVELVTDIQESIELKNGNP